MNDLLPQFIAFVQNEKLINPHDRLLLGISGGVDSMVLLNLMMRYAAEFPHDLAIAHVNHCLRPETAERDEVFVAEFAAKKNLVLYTRRFQVREYAEKEKMGLEEAARNLRLQYFRSLKSEYDFSCIVLGHHANDQAETVIMNLMRGSGPRGLAGIKAKAADIIHPLLFVNKNDIRSYAAANNIDFREDETNFEDIYQRNRIRNKVIPFIEKTVGKSIISTICRAAQLQKEVNDLLDNSVPDIESKTIISCSDTEIILDIYHFLTYLTAAQKWFLTVMIQRLSGQQNALSYHEQERLYNLLKNGRSGAKLLLTCGITFIRGTEEAILRTKKSNVLEREVAIGQTLSLSECGIEVNLTLLPDSVKPSFNSNRDEELLDYDLIPRPLMIRSFLQGDYFFPLGMDQKKKLHDYFIDEKIEIFRRSQIPLLVGDGNIIAILGQQIDNRYRVSEATKKILRIKIMRNNQ